MTAESGSGNERASKPRHRASVACVACRERRTRCVVHPGQSSCTQCLETGQECIIKNDDQRRKPVSKAYVSLLEDRIQQLETTLREKEEQSAASQEQNNGHVERFAVSVEDHTQPQPQPEPLPLFSLQSASAQSVCQSVSAGPPDSPPCRAVSPARSDSGKSSSPSLSSSSSSSMSYRLLSTRGYVSFDQLAGRQRYFGPMTNCHIYLDASESEESRRQAREQARRVQRVLSAVPQESQDYLMQLFWDHYNSAIRVVHQEAFDEGREAGGGPFYSGFLHICILAMGYRYADKQRPDMLRITLPGRESTLHREAKYMLDYELERPGGLPSIAALLILGDLETGCGRDNVGWLYSGMATRLCIDVGLHHSRAGCGLSQRDLEIGRMTLWACVIFDRYWALFLGRPTALKPDDLEMYELSHEFDRLGTGQQQPQQQSLETQIYQALFEVMELAEKITGIMYYASNRTADLDRLIYFRMAALDSELEKWYARLPDALKYTAENAKTAPQPFFFLHQQYYSTMIMLHRPFAGYDDILDSRGERKQQKNGGPAVNNHVAALSHAACTKCASRIAQIFWQQRQRFDTRKIFITGLQHAGNAATALVAAIASSTDRVSNDRSMRYLECLTAVLEDMSEPYQPAEQMATILKVVLQELRDLQPALQSPSSVPARRESSADCDSSEPDHAPSKRGPSSSSARAQTSAHSVQQPISRPGDDPFPKPSAVMPSSAILPSPALTYQSMSEKPTAHVTGQQDYSSLAANIDDSWPVFGHDSPSAFWPSAETSSFFPLANTPGSTNSDFMHLVEDPEAHRAEGIPDTSLAHSDRPAQWKQPLTSSDSIWTEITS